MTTSAPAWQSAIAIALPIPELAPVTRAFCPLRILRMSHCGITMFGRFSGIASRTFLLFIIIGHCLLIFEYGFDAKRSRCVSRFRVCSVTGFRCGERGCRRSINVEIIRRLDDGDEMEFFGFPRWTQFNLLFNGLERAN